MKNNKREYQDIKITKKESEWIVWFMKGANEWVNAYFEYNHRRLHKRFIQMENKTGSLVQSTGKSWFNKVLMMLKKKDLMLHVPFIWAGIPWIHPGVEGTKSNFVAISLDDANKEFKAEKAKII